MAKVVMTCGKICSGKSTYAAKLCSELNGVILSIDELTLALFNNEAGDKLDMYVERARSYLYKQSVRLIRAGVNVVLDWGFWTEAEREYAKRFYDSEGIEHELHYLSIDDELWKKRINGRNALVSEGKTDAYYVDEGLMEKFASIFQEPEDREINKIISQIGV
ncbi:MAG TPA: ATP-binding protein [Ruminococcus flavefaciens]|nr:ATP-binding protein [Ruminococcus flavefaciens]